MAPKVRNREAMAPLKHKSYFPRFPHPARAVVWAAGYRFNQGMAAITEMRASGVRGLLYAPRAADGDVVWGCRSVLS